MKKAAKAAQDNIVLGDDTHLSSNGGELLISQISAFGGTHALWETRAALAEQLKAMERERDMELADANRAAPRHSYTPLAQKMTDNMMVYGSTFHRENGDIEGHSCCPGSSVIIESHVRNMHFVLVLWLTGLQILTETIMGERDAANTQNESESEQGEQKYDKFKDTSYGKHVFLHLDKLKSRYLHSIPSRFFETLAKKEHVCSYHEHELLHVKYGGAYQRITIFTQRVTREIHV